MSVLKECSSFLVGIVRSFVYLKYQSYGIPSFTHPFIHSFIHSSIRNINHNGHNCFVHSKILWLQTKSGSLLCIMQVWNDRSVFFLPLQYPGLTRWLYLIICYISERRVHEFGTDFTAGRRKSKTER